MKSFLRKFIEFTKNTTVRVISFLIVVCLIASFFLFKDFYIHQWHKIQSYYYVYLGDKAYKARHPQEAINNYTRALELHPKHVKARYNLANLYVAYEDYYSAISNYKKALELKPDFMIARIDYAIVLSETTFNYDKAIQEYQYAIDHPPKWMYIPFIIDNKKTYKYNKGVAYYNQGLAWRGKSLVFGRERYKASRFLENAIKSYNEALKSIKDYDVYYNLGIANQLLGRNYTAGKNYCLAIEKEPMNYEAHYNLGILLDTMKNYKDSAEEFKKAGLILSSKGEANKTRYIYDILNSVNMRIARDLEGDENIFEDSLDATNVRMTYIGGKLVVSDEFDNLMVKNFKTCANKEAFQKGEDEEF